MTGQEPPFQRIMVAMRFLAVWVLLAVSRPVLADATANRDLVIEYTRIARGAALGGNCEIVRDLGEKVRALDAAYYAASYVTDQAIAPCIAPPKPVAPALPVAPLPPPVAPRSPPDAEPLPAPIAPPIRDRVPPLGGNLIFEVVLGGVASLVGIAGGGLLGAVVCLDDSGGEFDCLASVIIGAYAGGSIMMSVGVWAGGNADGQTGSLGTTIVGGLAGAGLGIALAFALEDSDDEKLVIGALILGPMVGSLIGFNATRRWKSSDPTSPSTPRRSSGPWGSLINVDRGRASVGVPIVVHGSLRGTPTTSMSLLSGSF